MRGEFELVEGLDLHSSVIEEGVLTARSRVWIATADLKDMHIRSARGRGRPVLDAFDDLAACGVQFRVIHASLPSRPFRTTLERYMSASYTVPWSFKSVRGVGSLSLSMTDSLTAVRLTLPVQVWG